MLTSSLIQRKMPFQPKKTLSSVMSLLLNKIVVYVGTKHLCSPKANS